MTNDHDGYKRALQSDALTDDYVRWAVAHGEDGILKLVRVMLRLADATETDIATLAHDLDRGRYAIVRRA